MVAHSGLIAPIWVSAMLELRLHLNTSGNPSAYTWAGRPKYRMTGCQMWGGTFSGPVGVLREESKNSLESWNLLLLPVYACVDGPFRSTWKTPSVSSMRIEPPPDPRAKLAMPVSALIASDDQQPAGLSAPCAQFRKDCWLPQKPSSGRWLRRGQRFFRNWTPGDDKDAGTWGEDAIRNITGTFSSNGSISSLVAWNTYGVFSETGSRSAQFAVSNNSRTGMATCQFDASVVVPTGPQNVPQHVWQPLCLYLGRSA